MADGSITPATEAAAVAPATEIELEEEDEQSSTSYNKGGEEGSGFFFRMWKRVVGDDIEKRIEIIKKEEASVQSRLNQRASTERLVIRNALFLSLNLEAVAVIYAFLRTRLRNLSWKMRAIRVLPVFIIPTLATIFYSGLTHLTRILNLRDRKTLEKLREERQAKIEELNERANYYMTHKLSQNDEPYPAEMVSSSSISTYKHPEASRYKSSGQDEIEETDLSRPGKSKDFELRRPVHVRRNSTSSSSTDSNAQNLVNNNSGNNKGWLGQFVCVFSGESPKQRDAVICTSCHMHNGFARKEELSYVVYNCPHCNAFNGPLKETKLHEKQAPLSHSYSSSCFLKISTEDETSSIYNNFHNRPSSSAISRELATESGVLKEDEVSYSSDSGEIYHDFDNSSLNDSRSWISAISGPVNGNSSTVTVTQIPMQGGESQQIKEGEVSYNSTKDILVTYPDEDQNPNSPITRDPVAVSPVSGLEEDLLTKSNKTKETELYEERDNYHYDESDSWSPVSVDPVSGNSVTVTVSELPASGSEEQIGADSWPIKERHRSEKDSFVTHPGENHLNGFPVAVTPLTDKSEEEMQSEPATYDDHHHHHDEREMGAVMESSGAECSVTVQELPAEDGVLTESNQSNNVQEMNVVYPDDSDSDSINDSHVLPESETDHSYDTLTDEEERDAVILNAVDRVTGNPVTSEEEQEDNPNAENESNGLSSVTGNPVTTEELPTGDGEGELWTDFQQADSSGSADAGAATLESLTESKPLEEQELVSPSHINNNINNDMKESNVLGSVTLRPVVGSTATVREQLTVEEPAKTNNGDEAKVHLEEIKTHEEGETSKLDERLDDKDETIQHLVEENKPDPASNATAALLNSNPITDSKQKDFRGIGSPVGPHWGNSKDFEPAQLTGLRHRKLVFASTVEIPAGNKLPHNFDANNVNNSEQNGATPVAASPVTVTDEEQLMGDGNVHINHRKPEEHELDLFPPVLTP